MQHHGVKTRLLDWTESFVTALYFATTNWIENKTITIWMLNPLRLNEKTLGSARFFTTNKDSFRDRLYEEEHKTFPPNSIALHPIKNNQRIIAQQGVFTVQGNSLQSLDKEFDGKLFNEGILKRVDIEFKYKEDVLTFLDLAGIHPFSIYPDLEGLAKYINSRTDY